MAPVRAVTARPADAGLIPSIASALQETRLEASPLPARVCTVLGGALLLAGSALAQRGHPNPPPPCPPPGFGHRDPRACDFYARDQADRDAPPGAGAAGGAVRGAVRGATLGAVVAGSEGARRGAAATAAPKQPSLNDMDCWALLRPGSDERTSMPLFMHGFFSGRTTPVLLPTDELAAATDRFFDHRIDRPNDKLLQVFAQMRKAR